MLAMLWIVILGGLLIMMGQQDRSEALFYYFRLSAQRFSTSPAKASLTILRAVTAPRPRTRYLIGTDAKLSAFLKRNLPDRWMDAIIFWMFGLPRRRLPGKPNSRLVGKPDIIQKRASR